MNEKRRYKRYPVYFDASYQDSDGTAALECKVIEVSREGMRLRVYKALPFSSVIVLSITVPGRSDPFTVEAEVKWSREFYDEERQAFLAGVEFTVIQEDERESILELGRKALTESR